MKYANTDIVFQEVPDQVTLAINISNCPCHCPGCHSPYLWEDSGEILDAHAIDKLMKQFGSNITCVSFMGGDANPAYINEMARYIHTAYPEYKVAWYTGRTIISPLVDVVNFDYIKVGPFIRHLGPLKSTTTNQHMYRVNHEDNSLEDVTSWFWRK